MIATKEKAAPGVSTGAALKALLPSAILTEDEAARNWWVSSPTSGKGSPLVSNPCTS